MSTHAKAVAVAILTSLVVACAFLLLTADRSIAEGGPPATGDWVVTDEYTLQDTVAVLKGNLIIEAEGDLTIRNSTIMVMCSYPGEYGVSVRSGGTLQVLNGSVFMPSKPNIQWTWTSTKGSRLVLRDSTIKWCGVPPSSGLTVNTADAVVEGCRFEDGYVGLHFPSATPAAPIRNCTFDTFNGISSIATDVEDCQFGGKTYIGIKGGVRISRCTFDGMRVCGIDACGSTNARIFECTFRDSPRGIWAENAQNLTVERCTFNGTFQEAIKLADHVGACSAHIVDGSFANLSTAFFLSGSPLLDWTVRGTAEVTGAHVMISGNLVLAKGARMRLRDCGNLSILSSTEKTRSVILGEDSVLELTNTNLEVPSEWWGVRYGVPVRIVGGEALLELNGVNILDVAYPVELRELRCTDTVLPLGSWNLRTVHLERCTLVPDARGGRSLLTLQGDQCSTSIGRAGELFGCFVDGIPASGASNVTWIDLRAGLLRSVDTLWDLCAMFSAGEVRMPEEEGVAMLEVGFTVRVEVRWRNAVPVGGALARIVDSELTEIEAMTDDDGLLPIDALATEIATSASGPRSLLPFEIDIDTHGIRSNITVPSVNEPTTVSFVVTDNRPPLLTVDQGDLVGTRSPNLLVSGRAVDFECGVAYLELIAEKQGPERVTLRPDGTFEVALDVSPGFQTLLLRLLDQSGNLAERSLRIFHSTRPPRIFSVELETGTLVNTTHVVLIGDTEPNAEVEAMGVTQLARGGSFRLTIPIFEGENRLTVNFTDLAGNRNTTTLRVVRDTIPPDLTITTPAHSPSITRERRSTIEGFTDPGCRILVNSVEAQTDASGRFSVSVSLTEGEVVFVVTACDAAGNAHTTDVLFVLDTQPPSLRVLWPPDDGLLTREGNLSFQLEVDADAVLTLNGERINVTGSPMTIGYRLAEGENVLVFNASDALGNACEVTRVVNMRSTPPLLVLDPQPPSVTSSPLLKLTGRTEAGVVLEVNGLAVAVDGEGRFHLSLLLTNGTTRFVVIGTDRYGNIANISFDVSLTLSAGEVTGPRPTLLPMLLLATAAILLVEGAVRVLWDRRRRRRASQVGGSDQADASSPPRRAG